MNIKILYFFYNILYKNIDIYGDNLISVYKLILNLIMTKIIIKYKYQLFFFFFLL